MTEPMTSPEWQRLLAAQRKLQALLPVLVGGTAAALHLHHRASIDGDHVLADLRERFDEIQGLLESTPGWQTARTRPPVLILGTLDGVPTGVRQLRRQRPLETVTIDGLRAPSRLEMSRVKAWLLLERNTVRDLVDTVALLEQLGGATLPEFARSFAAAGSLDLATYKDVRPPWNDLHEVRRRGRAIAATLAAIAMAGPGSKDGNG
jgi:hypothetical protein